MVTLIVVSVLVCMRSPSRAIALFWKETGLGGLSYNPEISQCERGEYVGNGRRMKILKWFSDLSHIGNNQGEIINM